MPHGTDNPPGEPNRTPQPNQILATPATVAACASDYGTPKERAQAAGAALDQLANARSVMVGLG
ncbi:hypothetical protein [Streptomyces sp. SP17KL33]|uniref:hypothetical protein n=1 Tax=Streptomyces sp. SP17KL33 TaxID=3002534 RepID=UPI002E766E61|nr:hypothetical protein [Streptomyces sp. SP17KL33]MEE1838186.1 hypothetical protein [Streptomyces sp. SP17KL33]